METFDEVDVRRIRLCALYLSKVSKAVNLKTFAKVLQYALKYNLAALCLEIDAFFWERLKSDAQVLSDQVKDVVIAVTVDGEPESQRSRFLRKEALRYVVILNGGRAYDPRYFPEGLPNDLQSFLGDELVRKHTRV